MHDLKFIRENPDLIRADLKKRQDNEKLAWVDELLKADEEYRKLLQENEKLRARRNEVTREISELKKQGADASKQLEEAKDIPAKIKQGDERIQELKDKIKHYQMRLPNILKDDVPYGEDEEGNETVKEWGDKPEFSFDLKPHGEVLENAGLANFEKAGEVSGNGFNYLMGDAVLLEMGLINLAIKYLITKDFTPIEPPLMLRRKPYEGVTDLADFETMMYKIEDEDLFLIATSEHSIGAMFMDHIFDEKELPKKYVGFSPCFRKELGSHSIDTKGLFRVHHFNKIEQFIFCKPEESEQFHQELLDNSEHLFQQLKLPYRVVNICTGDIGIVAAKKFDMEVWMPRENKYREVVSCSNCTAYQATRLNIKYRKGADKEYIHTLNSTAFATGRVIRAIVEHYQQEDGSIIVPEVLREFVGKDVIGKHS